MGKVLDILGHHRLSPNAIFDERFVLECCETFHLHWKNLRIVIEPDDFQRLLPTLSQLADVYSTHDSPTPREDLHIELARTRLCASPTSPDEVVIELCENLYKTKYQTECTFNDNEYVHIHLRELRIELPLSDFHVLASCIEDARARLEEVRNASLSDIFDDLNRADVRYVVIRNWSDLPEWNGDTEHGDLDILVHEDDLNHLISITHGVKVHKEQKRCQYAIPIAGIHGILHIEADFRTNEDNYFPPELSRRMLLNRRTLRNFFIPDVKDLYDSLLYHAAYHKRELRADYVEQLHDLHTQHGVGIPSNQLPRTGKVRSYLVEEGINFIQPQDTTVVPWGLPERDLDLERQRLSSRLLCTHNGREFHSRVFVTRRGTIEKEASAPLAKQERDILSQIQCECFPELINYRENDGWGVVELKYIEGSTLKHWMQTDQLTGYGDAADWLLQCLNIIRILRKAQVSHRDIRDENIMVSSTHRLILIDFGWATSGQFPMSITPTDLGGRIYRPHDGSICDVFAMGKVLGDLLVGYSAFNSIVSAMTIEDPERRITCIETLEKMVADVVDRLGARQQLRAALHRRTWTILRHIKNSRLYKYMRTKKWLVSVKEKCFG